jgi:uncharacterized protein YbaR (Trm112 family)
MTQSFKHIDIVVCPLCQGHGEAPKPLLALRWNDREIQRMLAQYGDEFAAGEHGGMDNPFESKEEATAGSTKKFHSRGDGVPKE